MTTLATLLMEEATLARVAAIAREAGRKVTARLEQGVHVWEKGPRDVVTDADIEAHRYITQALREAFPETEVWSEEGELPDPGDRPLWLVDPLDGTGNFARRFPVFAVSLALWWRGEPVLGAVYDPLRDHLFTAVRGGGAYLNGTHVLRVSDTATLEDALVACDWTRGPSRPMTLRAVNAVGLDVYALRFLGAAALGLAYVAAGWVDAYFNAQLQPWDFAAGWLLVEEAGGVVTTWQATPLPLQRTTVLAANPHVHRVILQRLAEEREDR